MRQSTGIFGSGSAVALLLALVLATTAGAQTLQPVPPLTARVTDLTGTLTAGQQAELEQKLASFEQRKGAQVALLIVPTTAPEAIEQYSIRVVDAWKLGRAKSDDGVLLLVALQDRTLRIEAGYGLEGVLPDAIARRIIDDTIKPLFRQGDIFGGVSAGLQQIMKVVDGEPLPPPDRKWQRPADKLIGLLPMLFFGVLIGGGVLRAIFGRTVGALATGGVAGGAVWLMSQLLGIAVLAGLAAAAFSLFAGLAGKMRGGGGRGGGWGGGFGGGLGGGGFGGGGFGRGGGGFGGGGGGFGGGGASGRW
ncbi:MAG: YgcG family protein [Steroidobacteraceae bacterium]